MCVFGSVVKTQSFAGSASLGELQLIQVLMNLNILERPCRDFLFLIRLLGPFFSLKTTKKARFEIFFKEPKNHKNLKSDQANTAEPQT